MQQRPVWTDWKDSLTSENRGSQDPGRNLVSNTEDVFGSILQRQVTPRRTRGILKTYHPPSPSSSPPTYLLIRCLNLLINFSAGSFPSWTKSCCGGWAVKRWSNLWNLGQSEVPHSTKSDPTGWAGCQYCNRQLLYRLPAESPCITQDCTVDKNSKKRGGIGKVAS